MMNRLIVPLSLKVMLVGSIPPEGTKSNQTYLYEYLSPDIKGISDDAIEPDFMSLVKWDESDRGAFLHISLPDALTKGTENETTKDIEYPDVPDRWLITRLWTADNKTIQSKCFLIESNALQTEKSSTLFNLRSASYPYLQDEDMPYRYIGRAYPVEIKGEELPVIDEVLEHLTAVAPANPCFAAFFGDCCNVFGFFDDLKDDNGNFLNNINITYSVCGWYSKNENDILSKVKDPEKCLENLSWSTAEGFAFPAATLCHGLISDINWKDENTNYTDGIPLDLEKPELAVGNTSMEALAAIAEAKKPKYFLNERMTNILLCNLKQKLLQPNGLVKSIDEIHKARFGNQSKIRKIAIKEKTKLRQEEYLSNKVLCEEINEELMEIVNGINELEMQLFSRNEELEGNQELLYDLFCKYVDRYNLEDIDEDDALLRMYIEKINGLGSSIESVREEKEKLSNQINTQGELLKSKAGDVYELLDMNEQRFWEANDPVLMLYGIDRNYSHGADGRFSDDNTVLCRSVSQINSSFTIEPIKDLLDKEVLVTANALLDFMYINQAIADYSMPCECINIIEEVILLSPGFSYVIAAFIARQVQIVDQNKITALAVAVKKLQTAPVNGEVHKCLDKQLLCAAAGFNGVFPEIYSIGYWKQPWSPLYLCWQLTYYPDPLVMEETPRLDNWGLSGDDYVYTGAEPLAKNNIVYKNRTVLTPYAAEVAAQMLKDLINDESITADIKNMSILSQKLNGFNERLLMRYLQLQTPIKMRKIDNTEFKDTVSGWLEDYNYEKPDFTKFFSPIRAGYMQINQINIVDTFGQTMKLNPSGAIVSENFRYSDSAFEKFIMLPPRIVQPSRINFDWIKEDQSPVCGWLLPNHIEKSLCCYSSEGVFLGSLQNVMLGDSSVVFRLPPEEGGMISDLPKDMDETLYQILSNIIDISKNNDDQKTNILEDVLMAIDSSLWNINPSSQQLFKGLSLFVGRPLAVVKAYVKLELLGKEKQCKRKERSIKDSGAFPYPHINKAEFNVRIGRKENHGDGVVGFFVNEDYSRLYLSATDSTSEYSYFCNENQIVLCTDEAYKPTEITFIMDSAGCIDFVSGILPVKTLRLPEELVKKSLNQLYLTIFSAPVLTDVFDISMPYPKTAGKQFSWVYLNEDKKIIEQDDIKQTTEQGFFPEAPFEAVEGWLKLNINDELNKQEE